LSGDDDKKRMAGDAKRVDTLQHAIVEEHRA